MPVGREGRIRIRSPHVASGYVGDPDSTAQMFRDGAFYSGDLGRITSDGVLVITGREKTVLLVGGESIAPETIEETLCGFAGIEQAAACAIDNADGIAEVHALIVAKSDIDEAALRTHCEATVRPSLVPVRLHRVNEIPRGGQGKIDRPRVLEIAKAGTKTA
jgi:acyl-CoA synthetase (AMP-forming)/AMP-acid ligase II